MRQIRKRRHGSGRRQPAPLPADARDPDIVHAHRVARRQSRDHSTAGPARAVERREPYGVWGGEIFHHGTITAHKKARGRPRAKVA